MLIQFSVENFLSIKDNVVLSLLASKDNEHPEHLIVDGNKKHLKSAVIYGANASGKSNVLNAFWFMVNYVLTSHNQQLHKTIDRSPFKFDRETPSRPSSFEVIFTQTDRTCRPASTGQFCTKYFSGTKTADADLIAIFIIQKFFHRAIQQNTRIVALLTQLDDVRTTRIFTDSRIQATKDFPIFSWLDAVEHAALL